MTGRGVASIRGVDLPTVRAAWWAFTSLRSTRRRLQRDAVADIAVKPPPPLPDHAGRGVDAVLRRASSTCLERALVLQRWLAEHGTMKDVVVGVTGRADFRAHAWLDGEAADERFQELLRLKPPQPPGSTRQSPAETSCGDG